MSSEEVFSGVLTETLHEIKLIRQDNHKLHVEQVKQNALIIATQEKLLEVVSDNSSMKQDFAQFKTELALIQYSRSMMWSMFLRWGGGIILAAVAAWVAMKSGG